MQNNNSAYCGAWNELYSKGANDDRAAFGMLSNDWSTYFTYIDFKGTGKGLTSEQLADFSQVARFTLRAYIQLQGDDPAPLKEAFWEPFDEKKDLLLSSELIKDDLFGQLTPEAPSKETRTFTFCST